VVRNYIRVDEIALCRRSKANTTSELECTYLVLSRHRQWDGLQNGITCIRNYSIACKGSSSVASSNVSTPSETSIKRDFGTGNALIHTLKSSTDSARSSLILEVLDSRWFTAWEACWFTVIHHFLSGNCQYSLLKHSCFRSQLCMLTKKKKTGFCTDSPLILYVAWFSTDSLILDAFWLHWFTDSGCLLVAYWFLILDDVKLVFYVAWFFWGDDVENQWQLWQQRKKSCHYSPYVNKTLL